MIERIRVVDIDTTSENGPRILRIHTRKNVIETPCRMITSTENKFKKDLALSPLDERAELETALFERVYTPRLKTILDLRRVNGVLNRLKRSINNSIRGFGDSISFLNLRFKKGKEPSNLRDVESLIHLQCRTNLDLVSIPDLSYIHEKKNFEFYIRGYRKYVEDLSGKETVPILDMNNPIDVFKTKIETVIENGFNMAVLRCRSFDEYYANYSFLKDTKREEEIWFHMVDSWRASPNPNAR